MISIISFALIFVHLIRFRGGEVSRRTSVVQSSYQCDVTSRRSVTFKMVSMVLVEETDKSLEFLTEILFRFLGFGGVN